MNGDSGPLTKEDGRLYVTEGGAITRTVADILSSPSRAKAAATMADLRSSNVEVALTDLERYCSGSASALHSIAVVDAEIERLTRERDEFRSMVGPAEDLERENDRLREALERLTTDYLTVRDCLYMSAGQLKLWAENQNPELNSRIQYRDAERVLQETPSSDAVRNGLYGEPNSAPETTASPQAPIVKVIIENGKAAYTTIYAPGLPDGTHDLYCEPEAVAPMMRAEAQTSGECPVCLGERRVTIGRRAIGQDSRIKALQMMYVEQPCPMCNAQKASDEFWQCPTCKRGVPRSETACLWCGPIIAQNGKAELGKPAGNEDHA